jgi:hypothetical protein
LHKAGYFRELLATNSDIDEGLCSLLRVCRETVVRLTPSRFHQQHRNLVLHLHHLPHQQG